ncbi:MAG: HD domain-containing protein [Fervidicoccaceae archaeon]
MLRKMSEDERNKIERIERIAKLIYPRHGTHGIEHIERVLAIALRIAEAEEDEVSEFILRASCLLHDSSRRKSSRNHAEESAALAGEILRGMGVEEGKVKRVLEAISSHSFSEKREQSSIESKILSDADKIDALGAVGVARVFQYAGEMGRTIEESIEHFREKILKLPEEMHTELGRKIANERALFVKAFLEQLERELGGVR